MPLTPEEAIKLLSNEARKTQGFSPPSQKGPLRFYDRERRCASRGCGSPTYCAIEGVPYCMMHSLYKLNDLVLEVQEVLEKRRA